MLIDPGDATSASGSAGNKTIKITEPDEAVDHHNIGVYNLVDTFTLNEFRALLRQHYDLVISFHELPRLLRAAGVYRQTGDPRSKWEWAFWFTGSSWAVRSQAVPKLAGELRRTRHLLHVAITTGYVQPTLDFTIGTPAESEAPADRLRNALRRPVNRVDAGHPRDNRP